MKWFVHRVKILNTIDAELFQLTAGFAEGLIYSMVAGQVAGIMSIKSKKVINSKNKELFGLPQDILVSQIHKCLLIFITLIIVANFLP